MTKQALPAVSVLTSETFEEFKTSDKVVVIGFFEADDKSTNTTFTEVADTLRDDFLFGATNDAKLAKEEGVKQPGVILYKSFDEGKDVYDGKINKDDVSKFAKTASIPLVGEVGPETYASYMAVCEPSRLMINDDTDIYRPKFLSPTFSPRHRKSAKSSQRL